MKRLAMALLESQIQPFHNNSTYSTIH